jgi:hypothetical protein
MKEIPVHLPLDRNRKAVKTVNSPDYFQVTVANNLMQISR